MSAAPPLILASASPRRQQLLQEAGLRFEVRAANIDEQEDPHGDPEAMTRHNATGKARHIAAQVPDALVLGSDTTVALDGRVYNKPRDLAEARAMLRSLSGHTHCVYTAVALIWQARGFEECFVETSRVTFHELDEATIDRYFAQVNPLDKAGAYGIQQGRDLIIAHLDGHPSTVMGLPIERVRERLRR
ncbi:MAG: Maf family protein, partial [Verrucomicrobiota bacterium]